MRNRGVYLVEGAEGLKNMKRLGSDFIKVIVVSVLIVWSLAATAEMKLYYVHNDHLNTPQLLTDENQNVVWAVESQTPFGEVVVNEDPDGDGESVVFNVRFPGQYFDEETGLSYNYYRTYDPSLGRYVQSDRLGLVDGPNTYAYVKNSPLMFVDPTGEQSSIIRGAGGASWWGGGASGSRGESGSGDSWSNPFSTPSSPSSSLPGLPELSWPSTTDPLDEAVAVCNSNNEAANDPVHDVAACMDGCEVELYEQLEYCLSNGGPDGPLSESQYQECLSFAGMRYESCTASCMGT